MQMPLGLTLLFLALLPACGRSCSAPGAVEDGDPAGANCESWDIPCHEAACDAGDAAACEAGAFALTAKDEARAQGLYDKACRLGSWRGCSSAIDRGGETPERRGWDRRAKERGCEGGVAGLCMGVARAYLGLDDAKARAAFARACTLGAKALVMVPGDKKMTCPTPDEALFARAAQAQSECDRGEAGDCRALGDVLLDIDEGRSTEAYEKSCARRGLTQSGSARACVGWFRTRLGAWPEPFITLPKAARERQFEAADRAGHGGFLPPDAVAPGASAPPKPLPPSVTPRLRVGAATVTGDLPAAAIEKAVQALEVDLRACYVSRLEGYPKLQGRVQVRFVIDRLGDTAFVANGASDMPDGEVIKCVLRSLQRLHVEPPAKGLVTVVVPITFTPR